MMLRLEKWKEASKNRGVENVLEEDFMRIIQIEKRVHLLEFITIQLRSNIILIFALKKMATKLKIVG